MKPEYVLGNWKSNKSRDEAQRWISEFQKAYRANQVVLEVIICPAYHHLELFIAAGLPVALGVQDISQFPSGAYTGEISAEMVAGQVKYALLGHSERRKNLGETDEIVAMKVTRALDKGIIPIVCVSDIRQVEALKKLAPNFATTGLLLYEPLFAVNSGNPDTPESANEFALAAGEILQGVRVLYGGSVKPDNVSGYFQQPDLAGVGVGGASLDALTFIRLIDGASFKSQ